MQSNFLKLNEDKTEIIVFGTKPKLTSLGSVQVRIGDNYITPSPTAKDLGVTYDQQMSMGIHVNNVCRSIYHQIHNIAQIRKYLSKPAIKTVVQACVTSRLDYANAILYGLPTCTINKLQKAQNSAARLITKARKSDHIRPFLAELHWLPVQSRIIFKVLLLTYKALHQQAPQYINDMVIPYTPARQLRSSNIPDLVVPKSHLRAWGDRTFTKAAATEWNKLPTALKNARSLAAFQKGLKTHLFKLAYD
jgi:hypothetical protein